MLINSGEFNNNYGIDSLFKETLSILNFFLKKCLFKPNIVLNLQP